MISSILSIVASVAGLVLTYFVGKFIVRWVGRYKRHQDTADVIKQRQKMADDARRLDDEKKKLDEAEKRFQDAP